MHCRDGGNSAGFDRTGRRWPEPTIGCAQPKSVRLRYDADSASCDHTPQSAAARSYIAEHASLHDHPDRCPYHHRSANELRSAFERASLEPAGDRLLTNPEEAGAMAIIGCNDNGYISLMRNAPPRAKNLPASEHKLS